MATDTISASTYASPASGTAWDNPADWSLGVLPQAGDAAVIQAAPVTPANYGSSQAIQTMSADPAYTVGSLTFSAGGLNSVSLDLEISNALTITGATTVAGFAGGEIDVHSGGFVQLQGLDTGVSVDDLGGSITAAAVSSAFIYNEGGTVTVAATTSTTVYNDAGVTSIGSATGGGDIVANGGTVIVGSFDSSIFFIPQGGSLVLESTGAALTNAVQYNGGTETIDLATVPFAQGETAALSSFLNASGTREQTASLLTSGGSVVFEFTNIYPAIGREFIQIGAQTAQAASDGNGGTLVTFAACYAAQTRIATPDGEVAIDELRIGDAVLTASGQVRPVKWIGRRSYAGRFLASNPQVQPVRFHAGSLGDGLPRRALLVSPDHAMLLDGALIPARCLLNGTTIRQERGLDRIDYVHVELDSHDVLLAEGAPSESFVDDDSRGLFHNAAEFTAMYPEAAVPARYCAPRVEQGAVLEAVRRRLVARVPGDRQERMAGSAAPSVGFAATAPAAQGRN